ncbi:MAG: hypothetical protein IRZ33_00420 [Alicyclobacillaceae bacterium]|nr:hypothetical protein [Alicyclobacillaceae bacterium]
MAHSDEEWRRRFREAPEVPFTDELRQQILKRAEQQLASTKRPARNRRGEPWRSLWACLGGLGGAAALIWAVWTYSPAAPAEPSAPRHPSVLRQIVPQANEHEELGQARVYGLQRAPISIGDIWIGTEAGQPPGSVVYATLTNVGTKPLGPQDVVGVLAFHPRGTSATLATSDWLAFVSGPAGTLQPGDTVTWSFRPVGAPVDAEHRLVEVPSVEFYNRGLVPVERADVVWRTPAGVDVTDIHVTPRLAWADGQSVELTATLTNGSGRSLNTRSLLALIWFAPQSVSDWTRPEVIRFLNQVQLQGGAVAVPPGGRVRLDFRLIGPAKVDFRQLAVRVSLVER